MTLRRCLRTPFHAANSTCKGALPHTFCAAFGRGDSEDFLNFVRSSLLLMARVAVVLLFAWVGWANVAPLPSGTLLQSGATLYRGLLRRNNITAVCQQRQKHWLPTSWRQYVDAICESIVRRREQSLKQNLRRLRVAIVGAGPVGLMSAITAYVAGADVVVFDKRREYNRDVWFDISARPWGAGLDLLKSWGFFAMLSELESPDEDKSNEVIQVRCQMLERFLAQTAMLCGIDVRHGLEYVGLNEARDTVLTSIGDSFEFDVLVGADGINSRVRKDLDIPFVGHNISQYSIVLDFVSCPTKRDDVDPWDVAKYVEGVPMIFRRFFAGECHMQILFSDVKAKSMPRNSTPWDLIFTVCKHVIEEEWATIEDLQKDVSHIDIVDVKMNRAEQGTVWLGPGRVGILVGDAVMSAHYRLGIGINNALNTMSNFGTYIRKLSLSDKSEWEKLTAEKARIDDERLSRMWGHQVKTMWLEAYCGYHLFFTFGKDKLDANDYRDDHFYTLEYTKPVDPTPNFSISRLIGSDFEDTTMEEATAACERKLNVVAPWKRSVKIRDDNVESHHDWDLNKKDEL